MQQRDQFKKVVCEKDGITLIIIPYWWNKTLESVAMTLHHARPDIVLPPTMLRGDVISDQMPTKVHNKGKIYPRKEKNAPKQFNLIGW